ncbi:uncharacterized protein LOC129289885 [Prosopis cineraria]|uniref:uncharacterized protein LOC129289885 n=1 Tax=Prosopis cineraria TaxID=364024 RepID=UPI00240EEFA2|nr:uncharacterized protein LOC129289885 [Prosopis cineraria]
MALELVGGAVLGLVFEQLRKEVWRVKNNVVTFKPKLEELEETLDFLCPVIEEIEELNRRLKGPDYRRETFALRRLLEDGTKLVSKCSKIGSWNFPKQCHYKEKLMELDNKILKFHNLHMQAHMARDQKKTLLMVNHIFMFLNLQGYPNLTMGHTAFSSSNDSINETSVLLLRIFFSYKSAEYIVLEGMAEESSSTSNGEMHRPGPCRIVAEPHHGLDLLVQLARLFPTSTVFECCRAQLEVLDIKLFTQISTRNFVLRRSHLLLLEPTSGSEHEDEENENGSVGSSYSYEPTRSDEKMTTQSYQPLLDSEQLHTVEANNAVN